MKLLAPVNRATEDDGLFPASNVHPLMIVPAAVMVNTLDVVLFKIAPGRQSMVTLAGEIVTVDAKLYVPAGTRILVLAARELAMQD